MESSVGNNNNPLALAFAVAALQDGGGGGGSGSGGDHLFFPVLNNITQHCRENNLALNQTTVTAHNNVEHHPRNPVGNDHGDDEVEEELEESCDDVEDRLAKSRERNREHARRTRQRKKAQLEALQTKIKLLEMERQALRQKVEERSIASILLGMASDQADTVTSDSGYYESVENAQMDVDENAVGKWTTAARKRFYAEHSGSQKQQHHQALKVFIDGQETLIGAGGHVNWKTGVYQDKHGVQRQLTTEQLQALRRERNKMHAKLTRNRRKSYVTAMKKVIDDLQNEIRDLNGTLGKLAILAQDCRLITPTSTPELTPLQPPNRLPEDGHEVVPAMVSSKSGTVLHQDEPISKRTSPNGFSLVG